MRKLTSVMLLIALLLLHGCVTEKDVSVPDKERVFSAAAEDIDGDSYTDLKRYVFRPILIDADQNIMVQKTVGAAQTGSAIRIRATNALGDADVSRLETLILEFDNSRREKEKECNALLGLSASECSAPSECATHCTSTECQKYGYASELLGYWIYDYQQNREAIESEAGDIRNAIVRIRDASPQEKETMIRKLSSIIDRSIAINNNPLLNRDMFGICEPIDYSNSKIRDMMNTLGVYDRTASTYTYVVNIKFSVSGKEYLEMKVSDSLPEAMMLTLQNVGISTAASSYDPETNAISWDAVKLNFYPEYLIGYSFNSSQIMREDIFANWPTPNIRMKLVSIARSPSIVYIFETSRSIYSLMKGFGYYFALAIALAFWDVLFFVLALLAKAMYSFMEATWKKASVGEALLKSFGNANPHWKEYATACTIFFVVGYIFMIIGSPVAEETLNVDNLGKNIVENPLGAVSMVLFFLSFHTAYALVEDRVKGVLVGRRYYENILEVSEKANELRFQSLQEKVSMLGTIINASPDLDLSNEKNALIAVPSERIALLLKKEGGERAVKELITVYLDKMDIALAQAKEKTRISQGYWPEWRKEISERIAEYGTVSFSALIGIPSEWRAWAAAKFIRENEGEGFTIENEAIKLRQDSREVRAENLFKRMISSNLALGGAVLKGDSVLAMHSSLGNRRVQTILSWRIANYARTLCQKLFGSQYKRIVIAGERNAAVFTRNEDIDGVLFAAREKTVDAFIEFEMRLKRL